MKIKIYSFFLALLTMLVLLSAVAFAADGVTDWQNQSVRADGFGAPPPGARNPAQAKALARRAAILDAYRNLGEYTEGVNVTSETTVKDMVVENDSIKTKMSALIKGAKIVAEQVNPDGSYQVTMQIAMFGGTDSLAAAVLPATQTIEPFPVPTATVVPVVKTPGNVPAPGPATPVNGHGYTGLIVDCSGLGLECVMSPVILDGNEKPIYGHKNLDPAKVIKYGMASYSRDGITDLDRAGNNPLVIKALRVAGNNCNPVISSEDANRVLSENQITGFLTNCAVVFIKK